MEFLKAARTFRFGACRTVRNIDFFSDRMSHRHTTTILLVFIILVTFRRFYSSPINCWVPAELKRYEKYINRYCWIKGTFYVKQNYDLNVLSVEARDESLLQYYQWVQFFLLIQAFLFYMPRIVWHYVSHRILDYDLSNMVDAAVKHECFPNNQSALLRYLCSHLNDEHTWTSADKHKLNLELNAKINSLAENAKEASNFKDFVVFQYRKFSRSLLTMSYVMVKLLYLIVALLQIYLMNVFLSNRKYSFYGYQVLQTILSGEADLGGQSDSRIFPRVTVCDIKTIELGTDHLYTVQCILSFNLFNERIYAFLWFWIVAVVVPFTCIDIFRWLRRLLVYSTRFNYQFIKDRLRIYDTLKRGDPKQRHLVRLFAEHYVSTDGVFVLRLIEHNSNAMVVSELINEMWKHFKIEQNIK
jgi:hypothetical protein